MKSIYVFLLCFSSVLNGVGAPYVMLQHYIDTRVGTAANTTQSAGTFGKHTEEYGQTLPAVLMPHGMNFWTPQTQDTERKCIAPYYYRDSKIQGFRNSHWIVGGCTQDYGSMTLMTVTGSLKTQPEQRASVFSHKSEIATPSYYSVYLDDYDVMAEMTAQSRSAIFRFTYDKAGMAYLVVNPNSDYGEGYIEIDLAKKEIRGYNPAHRIYQGWGEPTGFSGYFVIRFEGNPQEYGVYQDSLVLSGKTSVGKAEKIGAYVGFKVKAEEKILVKAASSFVSLDGAEKNLNAEIPGWNFDEIHTRLSQAWEQHLAKIKVQGSPKEMRKFYGAFYRTSFLPHVFNDVDGAYPAFSKGTPVCFVKNGDYYEDFSMWDTYRALHPLLTIIDTKRDGDMVRSLVDKYNQGGWLPIFPCWNSYTAAMIGDHSISVIGDAIMKGIKGFDVENAYAAMRKNAFETPSSFEEYKNGKGRRALTSYLKYGYIPLEDSVKEAFHTCEQVSRTLEYAYDDYVLSQVAQKLGKKSDYEILAKRAMNYGNVIDPRTGYAQGRHADGTFLNDDNAFKFVRFITEGVPAHYTWYVPHDVKGLMNVMGGKDKFMAKLDSMFSERRYWHGNEPCHQISYLFNYAGRPAETARQVRLLRQGEYDDTPGGMSGNDDAGQMSAWYVFSAMGFYPVCPGTPYYIIGSPSFPRMSIRLENGKTFTILAHNANKKNIYIQSAKLNGKEYDKNYFTHQDIIQGGTLEFQMGPNPNTNWGASALSLPPDNMK